MSWYAFHGYNNGKAINASTFDGTELNALGFHGYPTQQQAEQNPNSVPGFPNPLAAIAIPVVNAAIDDANNARDVASAPGNAAKAVAKNIPGVGSVDDAINWIKANGAHIFERAGEILVGLILIYVGIKAVATPPGGSPAARTVKDTVKTVVKRGK